MNKCRDRVMPLMNELYQKVCFNRLLFYLYFQYNQGPAASGVRYEQLREQNRQRQFPSAHHHAQEEQEYQQQPSEELSSHPQSGPSVYGEPAPYISGTPIRKDPYLGSPLGISSDQVSKDGKTNTYGDEGFS
jgi:hypothetical protein